MRCLDCTKPTSGNAYKYCKKCGYKHRKRPSGLNYQIKAKNRAWFVNGHIPWHKGKKGLLSDPWNKGLRGIHLSPNTEFTRERVLGENNPRWKGESVGYCALHRWVKKNYNWESQCEFCGDNRNLNLASKNWKYTRNKDDWFILCFKCHRQYDAKNNWGIASYKFNRYNEKDLPLGE